MRSGAGGADRLRQRGAVISADGKRRRTHVLRIVPSHSRKAYREAVFRQTTDDFIRCIENAFRPFGGVPRTLVPDNLKAAVIRADGFDPDIRSLSAPQVPPWDLPPRADPPLAFRLRPAQRDRARSFGYIEWNDREHLKSAWALIG